jgi:putative nucleotidyltransferase with HDIG domain
MGRAVDASSAPGLVSEIADSVTRNPSALISLARIKTADEYTFMHSVAVCALMVGLARQMGLNDEATQQAGLAGLLHDLGKAHIPLEILNKPGKLSDAEFALMRGHPGAGHALLQGQGLPAPVLDACLHHHEKIDGTGYPHRLPAEQITTLARMAAICDVYDAITSDRPYKAGWDPAESLRRMAEWTRDHLDQRLYQAFVKSLGIYPVGSLVRLTSGRLGVVTEPDMRIPPELIDLSAPGCREQIAGREDPARWQFPDLNELWSGLPHQPW